MDRGLCVLILTSLVGCVLTATPHIIPPTVSNGTEAAIIMVPGAELSAEAYKPLGLELQRSSYLRLWVIVLGEFIDNIPNPVELDDGVPKSVTLLRDQGMKSVNIFLAGHSLGGVMVDQYGKKNPQDIKGILLLASYLTKGTSLASYPLPVLTIAGDLDGLTRITRIADKFQELRSDVANSSAAMYRTPVVIMPGVNHGQFASGQMPPKVVKYDLDPEVDSTTAHTMIAKHCNDFMVSVLQEPSKVNAARLALKQAYNSTNDIMEPLLQIKAMDENDQKVSGWTIQAQKLLVASVNTTFDLKVTNQETDLAEFIKTKPKIKMLGSSKEVDTFTHVDLPLNPIDVSTIMAAFELARSRSSPAAKFRYATRAVRPMIFKDDIKLTTGLTWVPFKLKMTETAHTLEVTSGSLSTPLNFSIPSLAGMFYCKLLSPYRAMEWIYVDSLRK